ncbi:VWA domain-containing protein [Pseudolabrys sp.]|uniref:TadE/TadG family type IV pilus assembly protein n=1 Tax=Pseudolabrys sp. TaxID=1960880 RepID=UPI003D0DD5DA
MRGSGFLQALSQFARSTRGGVGPMLAISAIPLIGAVGAAVDYTRASAARTSFQNALDATALMLSRNAATQNSAQLQTAATSYLNAIFSRPDTSSVAVTATYSNVTGSSLTLNGTAVTAMNFSGILGLSQVNLHASSTVTWGNTRLRVALVLDNTGSMSSSGKMDALKTATQNLLNQLKDAAVDPEDVYVSVVPFSKDVNADPVNYDKPWVRWDLWENENGSCSNSDYRRKSSCESHGKVWTPAAHSTWNGCITDRDQNYDTKNTEPTEGASLFPAEQFDSCPVPMIGLTNDWTVLADKVTAMSPAGNTNQAIGLQWGWQTLTAAPFTVPPVDSNYEYKQVIILLTDGLNTENRWYSRQSSIDSRQEKTCDNIKAAGITIYAVQVNTGNDPTQSVLQYCASDSKKFFLLTSANQIITTFGQIGTALSNLRVAM